jgi:hypothetical protein
MVMNKDESIPLASLVFEVARGTKYVDAVRAFRRWYVRGIIERAGGNMSKAARVAGMDRSGFRRLAMTLDVFKPKPSMGPGNREIEDAFARGKVARR